MARAGFAVVDTHHHVGSLEALGLSTGPSGLSSEEAAGRDLEARIATMDTGATLFFDHRDPAMVSAIGNRPIHD